jgi:hypothetical protein
MSVLRSIGLFGIGICICFLLWTTSCSINTDPYFSQQEMEPFDTVVLNAVFKVRLQQGDHYAIAINGAQEIAESVSFHIDRHTLIIDNDNGPLWKHPRLEPPEITITFIKLGRVDATETCDLSSVDTITLDTFGLTLGSKLNFADLKLNCHLFYYWNSSPVGGMVTLSGHADFIRLYNASLLGIDASQLTTHEALVVEGSKSDIHVYADERLYYSISNTGNIYLTGNPGDIQAGPVTSTGKLIQ